MKSRKELLEWFTSLGINISKIEEVGKGTPICKVMSVIHPNFPKNYEKNPKNEYEYLKNMKVCQGFFADNKIELFFPVEKLIKCKLQDNLEITQWLYRYYMKKMGPCSTKKNSYTSSIESNEKRKNNKDESHDTVKKDIQQLINDSIMDSRSSVRNINSNIYTIDKINEKEDMLFDRNHRREEIIKNINEHNESLQIKNLEKLKNLEKEIEKLKEGLTNKDLQIDELKNKLGLFNDKDIIEVVRELEANRDFYFEKLVEIENYLYNQVEVDEKLKSDIFEILYRK